MKLFNVLFIFALISIVPSTPICPCVIGGGYEKCKTCEVDFDKQYCCGLSYSYSISGVTTEVKTCYPMSVKDLIQMDKVKEEISTDIIISILPPFDIKIDCGQSTPNGIYIRFSVFFLIILLLFN